MEENRKKAYLENTSDEIKKMYDNLEKAKKSKDIKKQNELTKEIKKMEESKRKELDEAVKK
jgi:rubrerythrin